MGDPSGRTKERDQLQTDTLDNNLQGLTENLSRIFNNYEELFDRNAGSQIQYEVGITTVNKNHNVIAGL